MTSSTFFDFLINILFFLIGTGIIGSFILLCISVWKIFTSESGKRELPKTPKRVSTDPLETLTEQQLEEFLSHLEEEKELAVFGFDKMSNTQREAAIAKKARIEKMIEKVEDAIGECYVRT